MAERVLYIVYFKDISLLTKKKTFNLIVMNNAYL